MNSIAPNDRIQSLERQHIELIDELDALNGRLELALKSFAKSSEDPTPAVTVAGPNSPIC